MAPPSLRQLLRPCRDLERDRYLILREAFLALADTREEIVRAGGSWLPSLWARGVEILRVRLGRQGTKGAGMTLDLNLRGRDRERLCSAPELDPRTRALVGSGKSDRVRMLVRSDDDLAEGLALAMLLIPAGGR